MATKKQVSSKQLPRLNQILAILVKSKGTQISVANSLGISSQSLGYYIKGRRIPASVIERWEQVYNQNLIAISKLHFDADIDTIVSAVGIPAAHANYKPEDSSQRAVDKEVVSVELWKQLQKDHAMFEKELERAWDLINRLLPQAIAQPVKRINTDQGQ